MRIVLDQCYFSAAIELDHDLLWQPRLAVRAVGHFVLPTVPTQVAAGKEDGSKGNIWYCKVHMYAFELPSQAISSQFWPEPTMEKSFSTVSMCSCVYELESIMRKDAVNEVKLSYGFDETKLRPSPMGLRFIFDSLRALIAIFRGAAESDNATELVPPGSEEHRTLLYLVIWQSPAGNIRWECAIDDELLEHGPDSKICLRIVKHLETLCRCLERFSLENSGGRHYVGRVKSKDRGDSTRQASIAHPSPAPAAPDCSSSAGSQSDMNESDVESATQE